MRSKIFDREAIQDWVAGRRAEGRKIAFTCGAFDILHAGHVEYLARAREHCDALIVAVNSDRSIQIYKSPLRPVNRQEDRLAVVAALEAVDAVTLMDEPRPLELLKLLKPDVYIKGGDYTAEQLRSKPLVDAYGGKVVCIPSNSQVSTSAILKQAALIELHDRVPEATSTQERRLIFLDRDGTLIRDIPFLHDPSRVELMPGVLEGLKELQNAGFTLVLITNQQGIGLGYYSEAEFIAVNQALLGLLGPAGIRISRIYYCPHSFADECDCRKPGTRLLQRAVQYFQTTYSLCYVIGDSVSDCMAGATVGCRSILVSEEKVHNAPCDYQTSSFRDAAQWILSSEQHSGRASARTTLTLDHQ
jgi:rfaE bifunctional protein nucleotidyltransferase chain/domain